MTVAELLEMLEGCDPNARVLVATQPSWPLQFDVDEALPGELTDDDEPDSDPEPVVYLAATSHPHGMSPYAPRSVFGE